MAYSGKNIGLSSYDDLFKTDEGRNTDEIKLIAISELHPFEQQPFKVLMDESMDELVESIEQNGVLSPIIARPRQEGGYEIIAGHRRVKASEIARLEKVPVVIKELDDDMAAILLVDSNLQREHILPSEKAFAYQMKLEAMKRQGQRTDLTSPQIGTRLRSDEELASQTGESRNQIQRYIRLTNLIDPILEMVDKKEIAMNAAVELSYLGAKEQVEVLRTMEQEDAPPSIEQAKKIRKAFEQGSLNADEILGIMQTRKEEKIKITITDDKLKRFFPRSYTKRQMEDVIMKLLENWNRKREAKER